MTQSYLHQIPPPSWVPVIAIGALLTMLAQLAGYMLPALLPQVGCFSSCCCALEPIPIGIVPALLAHRRDPALTPGQGFAVSFIATGLGSAIVALISILGTDQQGRAEYERIARETVQSINESAPAADRLTPEQVDASVATMMSVMPYVPVVLAMVFAVAAGVFGLLVVGMLRKRSAPPPVNPPTSPP